MRPFPPTYAEVNEASIAFYSGFFGSLTLCVAIHHLAPQFSQDRSILRLGLVIFFFGCLATSTWSLMAPYERFVSTSLRWRYGDTSPAIKRTIDRVATRKARYVGGIGRVATLASGFWAFSVLGSWPQMSGLAPYQTYLGWVSVFAWAALPFWALFTLRPLREALELKRQADEELKAGCGQIRDAEYSDRLREQAASPPVQTISPYSFQAGGEVWHWSDFYKNAAVFGMSGSGKTICVLNAILDGLVGSSANTSAPCSGLILDPKGDFQSKISALCREHGRERDLVIVDPSDLNLSIRWNPLDSQDDALEVASRFGAVMQILSNSSSDDAFWIESSVRLIQNLISLHRLAHPNMPPSLVGIYESAMSDESLLGMRRSIPAEVFSSNRTAMRTTDYFRNVWLPMPDNTKGSVRSFVSNMLGSFLIEPYDELFSGRSDVSLAEVVDRGLILYVNMPIADRETMARVVSTFIKLEFYREVLKRPNKKRPSFFLCDEFQSFFTVGQGRGDSDAFERTRQSNHANVIAFQNINALFKQTSQREQVMNLLGNCATKLFLRNTDDETNNYASTLFGKQIENLGGTSVTVGRGVRETGATASLSGSDQYQERVKQEEFSTLAVPSREDNVDFAETIGHLAARSNVRMERMRWRIHPIDEGGRP